MHALPWRQNQIRAAERHSQRPFIGGVRTPMAAVHPSPRGRLTDYHHRHRRRRPSRGRNPRRNSTSRSMSTPPPTTRTSVESPNNDDDEEMEEIVVDDETAIEVGENGSPEANDEMQTNINNATAQLALLAMIDRISSALSVNGETNERDASTDIEDVSMADHSQHPAVVTTSENTTVAAHQLRTTNNSSLDRRPSAVPQTITGSGVRRPVAPQTIGPGISIRPPIATGNRRAPPTPLTTTTAIRRAPPMSTPPTPADRRSYTAVRQTPSDGRQTPATRQRSNSSTTSLTQRRPTQQNTECRQQ